MKSSLLLFALSIGFFAHAQNNAIEIQPYVGFQFGNTLHANEGQLKTRDGLDWGGTLNFEVRPGVYLELMYSNMKTSMRLDQYFGPTRPSFDATIQYFHIGGLAEKSIGQVTPFGLFTLGAVDYNPDLPNYSNETQFSIAFGGGIKYFVTDNIGIRLQARGLMPLHFAGFGLFCGSGGCSGGAYTSSYTFAGDLTAGLILRLGGSSRVY